MTSTTARSSKSGGKPARKQEAAAAPSSSSKKHSPAAAKSIKHVHTTPAPPRPTASTTTVSLADDDDVTQTFVRGRHTQHTPVALSTTEASRRLTKDDNLFGRKGADSKKRKSALDQLKGDDAAKSKKKKRKASATGDAAEDAAVDAYLASIPKTVAPLRRQDLQVGQLLLGSIRSIADVELAVALPDGLTGYCVMREVSDTLASMVDQYIQQTDDVSEDQRMKLPALNSIFRVGQLIQCIVLSNNDTTSSHDTKHERITLSMRSSLVNKQLNVQSLTADDLIYGEVEKAETKGYIVGFHTSAQPPVTGFLPFKYVEAGSSADSEEQKAEDDSVKQKLPVGTPLMCVIKDKSHPTVWQLDARRKTLTAAELKESTDKRTDALTLQNLQPGLLVKCKVHKVTGNSSLVVSLFDDTFYGVIDYVHSKFHYNDSEQQYAVNEHKVGDKLKARIISVDYSAKRIYLTLASHIVQHYSGIALTADTQHSLTATKIATLRNGAILDDCTVLHVDSNNGLYLTYTDTTTNKQHLAYCSHKRVADTPSATPLSQHFKSQQVIEKCRIIGNNYLDGLLQVTMQQSVIDAPILSIGDLGIGQLIDVTVKSFTEEGGLNVALTPSIHATVAPHHNADLALKEPQRRYKVDEKLPCRVLTVDVDKQYVSLTAKKSLVNSTLPILTQYSAAKPNTVYMGYISVVADYGLIVHFYNNVHGIVPAKDLVKEGIITQQQMNGLSTVYKQHQPIKCRVISVDPAKEKMRLSLTLTANSNTADLLPTVGTLVSGTVVELIKPEDASQDEQKSASPAKHPFIRVKLSTKPYHTLVAVLPLKQLTDSGEADDATLQHYSKNGLQLDKLVVVHVDTRSQRVTVTARPLMVAAAQHSPALLATQLDQLQPNTLQLGTIRNISSFGIFVQLPCMPVTMTALVHNSLVTDKRNTKAADLYTIGQTVRIKVISLSGSADNLSDIKIKASMKHSEVLEAVGDAGVMQQVEVTALQLQYAQEVETAAEQWQQQLKSALYSLQTATADGATEEASSKSSKKKRKAKTADKDNTSSTLSAHSLIAGQQYTATITHTHNKTEAIVNINDSNQQVTAYTALTPVSSLRNIYHLLDGRQVNVVAAEPLAVNNKFASVVRITELINNSTHDADSHQSTTVKVESTEAKFYSSTITNVQQLLPSTPIDVKVIGTDDVYLNVELGPSMSDKVIGKVHACYLPTTGKKANSQPLEQYRKKSGSMLKAHVVTTKQRQVNDSGSTDHRVVVQLSLLPPAASTPVSLQRYTAGQQVTAFIKMLPEIQEVKDDEDGTVTRRAAPLYVSLAPNVKGRIKRISVERLEHLHVGQALQCTVESVNPTKKLLDLKPVAHSSTSSDKPALTSDVDFKPVQAGDVLEGTVHRVLTGINPLLVRLHPSKLVGRVHITETADEYKKHPQTFYEVGQSVKVYVKNMQQIQQQIQMDSSDEEDDEEERKTAPHQTTTRYVIDLSLRESRVNQTTPSTQHPTTYQDLAVDQIVTGYVKHISAAGCFIELSSSLTVRCENKHLADTRVSNKEAKFYAGKLVTGKVIKIDTESGHVDVSLKKSVVSGVNENTVTINDLKVGQIVSGEVTRITTFGVFVQLKHSDLSALAHISEVSDKKLSPTELQAYYTPGDKVRAKILKLDTVNKKISIGLKARHVMNAPQEEADVEMKQENAGDSAEVQAAGADDVEVNVSETINESASDDEASSGAEEDSADEDSVEMTEQLTSTADVVPAAASSSDSDSDDDSSDDETTKAEPAASPAAASTTASNESDDDAGEALPVLPASDLASITAMLNNSAATAAGGKKRALDESADTTESSSDSDAEKATVADKRRQKRLKTDAKSSAEARIAAAERRILEAGDQPESTADYERLLVQRPNDSDLYIQYMAHCLSSGEIEQARHISERALQNIHWRYPHEKAAIWTAYLNLENQFGSDASLDKLIKRAVQYNDPCTIHLEVAHIYAVSDKHDKAVKQYEHCVKQFGSSELRVWHDYGQYLYKQQKLTKARQLLTQALQRLQSKSAHIQVIEKFTVYEYRHGSLERGRTMFEGLIANYPKRIDLWNVYADMEIRQLKQHTEGDKPSAQSLQHVRNLFDRVTSVTLSTKKMKYFLKRALSFEREFGDEKHAEKVKQRAREYVASKVAAA